MVSIRKAQDSSRDVSSQESIFLPTYLVFMFLLRGQEAWLALSEHRKMDMHLHLFLSKSVRAIRPGSLNAILYTKCVTLKSDKSPSLTEVDWVPSEAVHVPGVSLSSEAV